MATPNLSKNFQLNGHNYEYLTNYSSSRDGFSHHCTLFKDQVAVANAHCHYINRTWERYTYQSVIHRTIATYFDQLKDKAISEWKTTNNRTRITKAERTQVTNNLDCEQNELLKLIDKSNLTY